MRNFGIALALLGLFCMSQASAQTITINFNGISDGSIGTYANPTSRGTALKNANPIISNFGGTGGGDLEIDNDRLRFQEANDYLQLGPFPDGISASDFEFAMSCSNNDYRKGRARVTVLNNLMAGVGSDSSGVFFEVSSSSYLTSSNSAQCVFPNAVPAGGYIFIRMVTPRGNNNQSLNPDGRFFVDNMEITPNPPDPNAAGTIDFETPSGDGDLHSYANPTTLGTQFKNANPKVADFGGVAHLQGSQSFPSYGGLALEDNLGSHMLMFEHPQDFLILGPFQYGVEAFQVIFTMYSFTGTTSYSKGRLRVTVLDANKAGYPGGGSGDSSGVFFETSSNYYPTSGPQTVCIFQNAIPPGGYIVLRRSSLYGQQTSGSPNGNFFIDNISYTPNLTPVELVSFRAYAKSGTVELRWKTATELNNYGFEVERSYDKTRWSKISFVHGHGTSFSPKEYTFTDANPDVTTGIAYYRLRQIDRDGTTEYSPIVSAEFSSVAPLAMSMTAFPLPFSADLSLRIESPTEEYVAIALYNSALQKLTNVYEGNVYGSTTISVNTDGLLDGIYFLIAETGRGHSTVQRVVKIR